jgi:hypothetical protein
MGVMATDRRRGWRFSAAAALLLLALIIVLLLLPPGAGATSAAQPVVQVANGAGRLDTLALYDLGGRSAALSTLVAADGAFTPAVGWQSGKGRFNAAKAKFVAGDVNGDGVADGVALYDLGKKTSCLYVFLANGSTFTKQVAWKSAKGAFAWSRAKLAVGDVDDDGLDDVLVLYDRGHGTSSVERFALTGKKFVKTAVWRSARGALAWSSSQIAAGDVTGDGKADLAVLTRDSAAVSRLTVVAESGGTFGAGEYWRGALSSKTRLLAGDVDSNGACDAIFFQDRGDGTTTLDVLLSSKSAFAAPVTWWTSQTGAVAWSGCRIACGDVTGDGKADVVVQAPSPGGSSQLIACVSKGTSFAAEQWWSGPLAAARTQLGCAPSPPFILGENTEVLGDAALAALESVAPDQSTFRFAEGSTQAEALAVGDVIVAEPGPQLPYGALRKVTAVSQTEGDVVVTTTQAALDEAVSDGELVVTGTVTQDDIVNVLHQAPGVRMVADTEGVRAHGLSKKRERRAGITLEFDLTLLETIKLQGSLGFTQSFSLSATNSFGFLQKVRVTSTTTQTTSLRAAVQQSFNREFKKEIGSYSFPTFWVTFGVVPVCFTPELSIYIGAEGDVTVGVSARVTQTTTATAGVEWSVGDRLPTPVKEFTTVRTYETPRLFGTMSLKAFAGIQMMLKIMMVAGPTLAVEPYLGLFADTRDTPWWKLAFGVDVEAGGKVEALDVTIVELALPFNLFEYVILEAPGRFQETQVSGKITAEDTGAAIAGATVELREGADDPAGEIWGTTTSAMSGTYTFSGPPGGAYTLVVRKTGYLQGSRNVEVLAGSVATGQDLALRPGPPQGVTGLIMERSVRYIAGATVELREGADSPNGALLGRTTSGVDGRYEIIGAPAGTCTVVASKAGYATGWITATIKEGTITANMDVYLTPVTPGGIAQATDGEAFIRYPEQMGVIDAGGTLLAAATYEFWFKTTVESEVERSGTLAMVSMGYGNWPGGESGIAPIMKILVDGRGTITFGLNENSGGGPLNGTWHFIRGRSQPQVAQWVHVAAQCGSGGMKLFVDGKLEASDAAYKGSPEPDWSDGTQSGGWFSMGDNDTREPGGLTARGYYKELRVSRGQRYTADFTPPAAASEDGTTLILDHLIGGTIGENRGFVWLP